jgi:hypothetical protein
VLRRGSVGRGVRTEAEVASSLFREMERAGPAYVGGTSGYENDAIIHLDLRYHRTELPLFFLKAHRVLSFVNTTLGPHRS